MDFEGSGRSSSYDAGCARASASLGPQTPVAQAAATSLADEPGAAPSSCAMASMLSGSPSRREISPTGPMLGDGVVRCARWARAQSLAHRTPMAAKAVAAGAS